MKIAVAGLGLIGGSLAKGFTDFSGAEVYGHDKDESTILRAKLTSSIKESLTKKNISLCEYIFIALYPQATIDFLKEYAPFISKEAIVVDCGGVKRRICEECGEIAKKYGFCFVGGHPMAGTHNSGFKYSRASMFEKATMVLVPQKNEKIERLQKLKELLLKIGFKGVVISTASEHDRIIAFTSQLAHIVSNAYVKSPNARVHKGFSAGSFRDLTRVAKLNADMWTQLFMENADNIKAELDCIIGELTKYKQAIENNDEKELKLLLEEGTIIKESIG